MKCSVIILNWNGAELLRQFLPSVVKYTQLPDCEIVIADNGSTDNSLEVLQTEFPTVRVLSFNKNLGFAGGYNRALAKLDARYAVLLNSDVEVTEGWLQPLLDYMDEHTHTAAVQPKILSWRERGRFEHAGAAGGELDLLGYPYCRGRVLDYTEEDHGQYDTADRIFWASGACMCVRVHLYRQAGGLDKEFFAHMEEIDLCWRLQCRGWNIGCVPQSVVYHLGGASLPYGTPQKTYLNFRNNLIMLYKNLPLYRLLWVMPIRFVLDYIAVLHDLLGGRPRNAWAIFRARLGYQFGKLTFFGKRRENMQCNIVPLPHTFSLRSIVFDYYVLRHKTAE